MGRAGRVFNRGVTIKAYAPVETTDRETPMGCEQDGMLVVRADLCDRLDRLQLAAERMTVGDLMHDLGAIRALAAAYGLSPVVTLAEMFERAIQAQPRHCPAGLYFDRLRDAVGCEPSDAAASQALLASVSIRLGG
jgi:hypothetical protein